MEKKKKREIIVYVLLILFIIVVILLFINLSKGRTNIFGSASSTGIPDVGNSYVFVSPVSGRVGGDKIRVTAFVLNGQGKGVFGQEVTVVCTDQLLCQNSGVSLYPIQETTDNMGQGIWEMTANSAGKFTLQAIVSDKAIPQTVTVDFR